METKNATIKALTIHQPWASAIANGKKHIETRSWPTKYRGPLLIHAGLAMPLYTLTFATWDHPLGALIAVCELVDCLRVEDAYVTEPERKLGDYSPGRFAWVLAAARPLAKPIPYRGRLGLWNFPVEKLPAGVLDGK